MKTIRNADLMATGQVLQEFVPVDPPNIPGLKRREPAVSRPTTGETILTIGGLMLVATTLVAVKTFAHLPQTFH